MLEEEGGEELLPAAGLVTTSEEYYPTIAINSLMRSLRDPAMVSLHEPVVKALFTIFGALGLTSVPYLPKARSLCTQLDTWKERSPALSHVHVCVNDI